jgi:hypothetical protein
MKGHAFFRLSHTTLINDQVLTMSIKNNTINKSSYVREEEPGFLENLGVKYYRYLGKKSGTAGLRNLTIDELPADVTLQTLAGNITAFAAIIAFAIGALTTFVTIWVEWTYQESMDSTAYYLLYGSVLDIMLVIELAVLYWLALKRFSVWRA